MNGSLLRPAARRLVERAGFSRTARALALDVPRFRTGAPANRPPTAWVVAPDFARPSGGIRKEYRAVDVLNDAGFAAAVVHTQPGFRCTWFEHETRVVAAEDVRLGEQDVVVVPETYWPGVRNLPPGIRQVIYNQNAYMTLDAVAEVGAAAWAPYLDNPDLASVLVVSEENAEALRYACPGVPVHRIRHALDPRLHHPVVATSPLRIGYMPRKRGCEAAQVLALLERRGALDGWELVPMSGLSEVEVADTMRSCQVFLSMSEREGFGLPPLEAMACGCLVVGFDGFAGREFFEAPYAISVENGDVVGAARAVESVLAWVEQDPVSAGRAALEGARRAHATYSDSAECDDLLAAFGPLLRR